MRHRSRNDTYSNASSFAKPRRKHKYVALRLIWLSLTIIKVVFPALFDEPSFDVLLVHLHSISSKIIEKSSPLWRKAFLRSRWRDN